MLTRRDFVLGAAAAGALLHTRFGFAKASQPTTPVNFDIPAGACDCHTHIHGDPVHYPWFAGRTYTPEMALPAEMSALHKALHIQRVVIVTPSVYGTDNTATVYGMKARGKNARGVAVIGDKTTDVEIDNLMRLGFKGMRLNLSTAGINRARRNLVEWDQDESALGQPRMGNLKAGLADSEVPYQQDIQVERPGSGEDAGSPVPAKLLFNGQQRDVTMQHLHHPS